MFDIPLDITESMRRIVSLSDAIEAATESAYRETRGMDNKTILVRTQLLKASNKIIKVRLILELGKLVKKLNDWSLHVTEFQDVQRLINTDIGGSILLDGIEGIISGKPEVKQS